MDPIEIKDSVEPALRCGWIDISVKAEGSSPIIRPEQL
jgi:hypothetical protein